MRKLEGRRTQANHTNPRHLIQQASKIRELGIPAVLRKIGT